MDALDYDANIISRDLDNLCSTDFDVDPDPFLERIVDLGMLPAHVARMERGKFEKHFGAVLNYGDVQIGDERQEMKAFVIVASHPK